MLSKEGNPGIRNIRAILDALQLEIRIVDKTIQAN
jgi:DNA-binding phage protein